VGGSVATAEGTFAEESNEGAMRTVFVVIGVFVVLILLVSSGIVGGGLCLKGVGCLATSNNGATVNDQTTVTITTGK